MRLARGEPVLATPRPRWFIYAFGFWLAWMIIHIQQEVVFQVMTGGKVVLVNEMNAFQKSLYTYQFMVFRHVLIFGGLALALTLFFHARISSGSTRASLRASRRLFAVAVAVVIAAGTLRFGLVRRRPEVLGRGGRQEPDPRALRGGLPGGGLLGADLPGDRLQDPAVIRRPDTVQGEGMFEQYPITHFILRFPTLFEVPVRRTYPDFEDVAAPIRIFGLCGREATMVRYDDWPGFRRCPLHAHRL